MKSYFINLDSETERRALLQASFKACAPQGFELERIAAVGAVDIQRNSVPGKLRDTAKACILSHQKAIEASLSDPTNSLILEDDATLGAIGFEVLNGLLQGDHGDVDIIVTSSLVTNTDFLLNQYMLYRKTMHNKQIHLLNMQGMQSAGSDSYIICQRSKSKLLNLLQQIESYDVEYDMLLKQWIHEGRIKAVLAFPFLTCLSSFSDSSQITEPNKDWNQFRRVFSLDYEKSVENQLRKGIPANQAIDTFTDEYLALLKIIITQYVSYQDSV
jgi:GR25 family glycosyltransferase involved in LPS biosynthesis